MVFIYDTIYGIIIMSKIKKIIEKISKRPYSNNVSYSELKKYLLHYSFKEIRISGSHHMFISAHGKRLIVPSHDNKVLAVYVKNAYDLVKEMEDLNEEN